jgi:hypothetical protein
VLLGVFSFKFYINEKRTAFQNAREFVALKQKINQIVYLKNRYRYKPLNIKFCTVNELSQKAVLECKNLNKNQFNILQNIVFRGNYKINKFQIKKHDKFTDVNVEILK